MPFSHIELCDQAPTWRFMGTYNNHNDKSTYNLLRGLRGLIRAVLIEVISTPSRPPRQVIDLPKSAPSKAARSMEGRAAGKQLETFTAHRRAARLTLNQRLLNPLIKTCPFKF